MKIKKKKGFSKKGSYTLEAAVVIPCVAAFWVAILFFFQVLQVETGVQEALFYAGRMTAVEACKVEGDTALLGSAEVLFRKELGQYPLIGKIVKGGSLGITLLNSETKNDTLHLCAEYQVRLPFSLLGAQGIRIVQNSNNHKWIGKSPSMSGSGGDGEDGDVVYVTDHGSVYHCSEECSYLKLSIQTTTSNNIGNLRNKDGAIYYACSCCKGNAGGTVYYTDYGTNYHSSLECSGLKRTTHTVSKSEVEGMRPCSKCGVVH